MTKRAWLFVTGGVIVFFVGICLFILVSLYGQYPSKKYRLFNFKPGTSAYALADQLKEEHFIRYKWAFLFFVLLQGSTHLQSGEYRFSQGDSTHTVYLKLLKGQAIGVSIGIGEGWTAKYIDRVLVANRVLSPAAGKIFKKLVWDPKYAQSLGINAPNLEGFLYPSTYIFSRYTDPKVVIKTMVNTFKSKWETLIGTPYENSDYSTVILASVVQSEAGYPGDFAKIASVFKNRLKQHMTLGSDAVLVYIITDIEDKPRPKRIRGADMMFIKSPYNTYIHQGLPPAPICSPGINAIIATKYSPITDYLFFVVDPYHPGHSFFSKTAAQHEKYKKIYINATFGSNDNDLSKSNRSN